MSALKYACLKAKKNNADIEILSVLDTAHKGYALFAVDKVMDQENRDNQDKLLKEVIKKAKEWSGITPVVNSREGIVIDQISEVLEHDKSISLIILASSEESTSKGKITSHIAEQSSVKIFTPIIIIPNNITDLEIKKII
ncbi:MAG: universal stress protein [Alphaproteobacteria bacterium]|jgi:hypothetical protein|nr:universal stress protein [Alphaproteobacteria bacterium]MBT5828006.1 universal stress protein [Alphaproteobacteria bacterium]